MKNSKLSLKTQSARSTGWKEKMYNAINVFAGGNEIEVLASEGWGKNEMGTDYKIALKLEGELFTFNSISELKKQLSK